MKHQARIQILNYITKFCLSRNYGDGINRGGILDCYFEPKDQPVIGDLVTLQSSPNTEWYLSWYKSINPGRDSFCHQHLLESIETGKLCNWSNISFYALNRELVDKHPEWKWEDKQFKFKAQWFRACYKRRDAYIIRPNSPQFNKDGSVKITLRKMFSDNIVATKKFDNWKKVLVRDMLEFYDSVKQ